MKHEECYPAHSFDPFSGRCARCNLHRYHLPAMMSDLSRTPGAPFKLESWHSTDDKARWKIVRMDDFTDVEGTIITADEATGECCLSVKGETKTLSFGPHGIRIVGRRR